MAIIVKEFLGLRTKTADEPVMTGQLIVSNLFDYVQSCNYNIYY